MATYQASHLRAVALELQEKTLTLYLQLLPIFSATARMKLNGHDQELPVPFDVKVQLDAYKALKLETLKLEWVTDLQAATPADSLPAPALTFTTDLIFNDALTF
jgi:hypothetical protein